MTDRAINFSDIVDAIREHSESATDASSVVTVEGSDPIDICERLYDRLDAAVDTDRTACEFYVSPNVRRETERGLVDRGPADASLDFLERRIRTDVSMPDDAVLFMRPDAVTLDGMPTGSSTVGLGTIASDA